jgi:hypothetical protein
MRHTALLLAAALTCAPLTAFAEPHDGRARAWIVNPLGEVDGVLLSDHATVRFSPTTGADVVRHVRLGERVVVSSDGQRLSSPRTGWTVDIGMSALSARGGGPPSRPSFTTRERASDGMVIAGGRAPGAQRFTVDGTVQSLTYTRSQLVDGVLLRGGITVRVPSSRAGALGSLRPGARVVVVGDGVRGPRGIGIRANQIRDARGVVLFSEDVSQR